MNKIPNKTSKKSHLQIEKQRRRRKTLAFEDLIKCLRLYYYFKFSTRQSQANIIERSISFLHSFEDCKQENFLPIEYKFNQLLLNTFSGFLIIINCENGQIEYFSEGIKKFLYLESEELMNKTIFDQIHPNDLEDFKSQISIQYNTKVILNRNTGLSKSKIDPNLKKQRSFACRIKNNNEHYALFKLNGTLEALNNSETINFKFYFIATVRMLEPRNIFIVNIRDSGIKYNLRLDQNRKIKSVDQELIFLLDKNILNICQFRLHDLCVKQDRKLVIDALEKLKHLPLETVVFEINIQKNSKILKFVVKASNCMNVFDGGFESILVELDLLN